MRAPKNPCLPANSEVTLKFPTIAILAAAATFFAASLSNADAASRSRRGHNAYASAPPHADASPSEPDGARASALRGCNKAVANMYEQTWGVQGTAEYRACMASHGQME